MRTLFDPKPKAAPYDPQSSHDAAKYMKKTKGADAQREQIFDALKTYNGSTSKDLAIKAGFNRGATGRRLPELRAQGRVQNCPNLCDREPCQPVRCQLALYKRGEDDPVKSITWWVRPASGE
jgi:hypothetical protein